MMQAWTKIIELADYISKRLSDTGTPVENDLDEYEWNNCVYQSGIYRRAHLQIIDRIETHKIYILHATIFPHHNDPSPIWGFDAVCGANKITGAFHDFSPAGHSDHRMIREFALMTKDFKSARARELPDWARPIFSPHMIAAGFIRDQDEIEGLCNLARSTLEHYLQNVGLSQESCTSYNFRLDQNFYCQQQKKNPHVIKSMVAMGVDEDKMKQFVNEVLFPEVQ